MNNTIVYGSVGTGTKTLFFDHILKESMGKIIGITFDEPDEQLEGFKKIELDSTSLILDDVISNEKILLVVNKYANPYFYNETLKKILTIVTNTKEKILLAFSDFAFFNLSEEGENSNSIIMNVLGSENITTVLIIQALEQLKEIYKRDYDKIIGKCEVTTTNFFSGELRVRFPKSLHRELSIRAAIEGVSLNQYINHILSQYIGSNNK